VKRKDLFAICSQTRLRTLTIDTKVGLTFARVASEAAEGSEKRRRNKANARRAYDSVLLFWKRGGFEDTEMQQLAEGLSRLKSALEGLGEFFPSTPFPITN